MQPDASLAPENSLSRKKCRSVMGRSDQSRNRRQVEVGDDGGAHVETADYVGRSLFQRIKQATGTGMMIRSVTPLPSSIAASY